MPVHIFIMLLEPLFSPTLDGLKQYFEISIYTQLVITASRDQQFVHKYYFCLNIKYWVLVCVYAAHISYEEIGDHPLHGVF